MTAAPDTALYLALDQGGHASRALLFDARGNLAIQAFAPIETRRFDDGRVEHDAEDMVHSFDVAIGNAAQRLAAAGDPRRVCAAGLATQRSTIVCWDRRSGAALSPVISWQDRRNAAFIASLDSHAAQVHALTGLMLTPHYGASKLRWCLEHLPRVREAAAAGWLALGPLSSFLLFRLLKQRPLVVDPANASRTQLWNPSSGRWAPELLTLFGVAERHLPLPVESRHAFGTLEFAAMEVPLVACTGDQSAVPFAFGAPRVDTAYVNMGTGAFIQRPIPGAVLAPPLLSSVLWAEKGRALWTLEGTVNGAGSAVDWFAQLNAVDTQTLFTQLPPHPDEADRPLFLNGVSGLGSPFWIADFHSEFIGGGDRGRRFLALLESIVFLIRANLDVMRRHPPALAGITITGGLATADFLCQWLADLTMLPVTRHADKEATARGLAFLLAGRPDRWQASTEHAFEPRANVALGARFDAWSNAMNVKIAAFRGT